MTGENSELCVVCQNERVFRLGRFDKCLLCAKKTRDRLYAEFIPKLSPEQLAFFETYKKADDDFTSMMILD